MMFSFMWTTVLDTSCFLNPAWESYMIPPPIVLILEHIQVHIHISDSGNIASYIKTPINEIFGLATTLNVPYIYLDNGHVWFR